MLRLMLNTYFSQIFIIGLILGSLLAPDSFAQTSPLQKPETVDTRTSHLKKENHLPSLQADPATPKNQIGPLNNTKISPTQQRCSFKSFDRVPWLDKAHNAFSSSVCNQAVFIDKFFGDVSYNDDQPSSLWRIRNTVSLIDKDKVELEMNPKVKAKIRLPNVRKKLNLIISDDEEDDQNSTQNTANKRPQIQHSTTRKENVSTKIQWTSYRKNGKTNKFDIGIRYKDGFNPFVKDTVNFAYTLSATSTLDLYQSIFWRDEIGYGESTEAVFERLMYNAHLLRASYNVTFSEESEGVDLFSQVNYYIPIDSFRIISLGFFSLAHTRPAYYIENTGFGIRYRKRIYSDWLFFEYEPEITWPEERNKKTTPALHFRLEAQFGS